MTDGKVISLDEIFEKVRPPQQYRNVSEIINQPVVVTDVEFKEHERGTITIIKTNLGEFYTFSQVLKDQFEKLKHYLENNKDIAGVELVIRKRKRYYYIDSP